MGFCSITTTTGWVQGRIATGWIPRRAREAPIPIKCNAASEEGNEGCEGKRPKHDMSEITCFKCRLKGHFASKCLEAKKQDEVRIPNCVNLSHVVTSQSHESCVVQSIVGLELAT